MPDTNQYDYAVWRLESAHEIVNRLWQNAPDIQPDLVPDFVAVQAWPWVSNGYQLVEQALKVLLAVRQDLSLRDLGGRLFRSHNLDDLFAELEDDDREAVSHGYASFVDLHRYIGVSEASKFLKSIGGGYALWRYLLKEGLQDLPPTHVGALLEIADAAIARLRFHVFGKRDRFTPVMDRIRFAIDLDIGHVSRHRGTIEEVESHHDRLRREVLLDANLRYVVAAHLENTDSPLLGPQPEPNPFTRHRPPLPAGPIAELVEVWKRSRDRKNLVVYFRRPPVSI